MKLAAHELHDLNELTMSCVNSITNMAYMLDHVKDPEFKDMLKRHFPYHVRDYNMKVEFINNQQGAQKELPRFKINGNLTNYAQSIISEYLPIQPRTTVTDMDDREMATAYLLTLKRAGREYAWAAMETANPEIRGFLETAFLMSSSHAYDVWQYMVDKGYYPLEQADQQMTSKIGNMYQVVPEDQQRINHLANQYNNAIDSNRENMYQHEQILINK
ncbi:spore coat protein [Anaerophilus nitritogenes]|uniref:spore coat protein n=1 Tax=Anaerophilus nitritogenes TaxID=2498136 RepID=UPI00101DA7E8